MAGITRERVIDTDVIGEPVREPLVVRLLERRPLDEDAQPVALSERVTVARDERGRFLSAWKEGPTVEPVLARDREQARDLFRLGRARPWDPAPAVARPAGEDMLIGEHPDGNAVAAETADDAEALVVAADDERAGSAFGDTAHG